MPFQRVYIDQDTREWRRWRCGGVGASDAPCLMGEDPWKSEGTLTQEKLNPRLEAAWIGSAATRGKNLEPVARAVYCNRKKALVEPMCVESLRLPWMRASLDGINLDEQLVVEIKCGEKTYAHVRRNRCVPGHYYGQLQHILAVLGYEKIDFWCFSPGWPACLIEVRRNDGYIKRLVAKEQEFWDFVGPAVAKHLQSMGASEARPINLA